MPASSQWYQLRIAVAAKNFEEAAALLARRPSLISEVNGLGETVLHYLAVENDEAGVSWLASRGFDLNTRNAFGWPVVFEVAQLDYRALLRWFIANGAEMKARDPEGHDIREHVMSFGHTEVAAYLDSLGV